MCSVSPSSASRKCVHPVRQIPDERALCRILALLQRMSFIWSPSVPAMELYGQRSKVNRADCRIFLGSGLVQRRFFGGIILMKGVQWMIVRDWMSVISLCANTLRHSLLKFPNLRSFEAK
jgi:hypothetical protein